MLRFDGVVKRYAQPEGEVTVLAGVDLAIAPGEAVALLGESGSGKSTLLHLAAGLDAPDAGRIEVGGQTLSMLDERALAALRRGTVSLVFQQFHLIGTLTVADNIRFQAALCDRLDPAFEAELVERLGLGAQLDKYPHQLSGGQQQRVAIARALLHRPPLVLADEPTGNLDERSSGAVMALFRELVQAAGSALLMVTHSHGMADYLDRRLWLHDGRLQHAPG
ncbi:ABC transporter ATP-binding protein [Denitromonas iodatirespirans]|uniref:ABC transporter ATP-binding protein n=1 Tax=Denitromonas iodatirespirans TaxID=2795389 RepID=A0A944DBU3_DENI1|nr:ABC transporter ATP-binding protein [Denitromonas iodatirespirans]MBT0962547.1 ABC transporter ATP-binding protein [Denitromonas iodatirespirans]